MQSLELDTRTKTAMQAGVGTTEKSFELPEEQTIPACNTRSHVYAVAELPQADQQNKVSPAKARVLVVDDEHDVLTSVEKRLAFEGYQVCAMKDGTSVFSSVELFRPDVIVMDILLPDTTGYALVDYLRLQEYTRTTPVIFLTATSFDFSMDRFEPCMFMSKPFKSQDLIDAVRSALENRMLRKF